MKIFYSRKDCNLFLGLKIGSEKPRATMVYRNIKIKTETNHMYTSGLFPDYLEYELGMKKGKGEDCLEAIQYVIDYVKDHKAILKPNQTISYYSWIFLLRVSMDERYLLIHEPIDDGGENFEEGGIRGLQIIEAQKIQCEKLKVAPAWPVFTQQLVISEGVYEGDPIEGIRYPSPTELCGWWLITDRYNGDIKSLKTVHYYHIAFKRQDILQLLALPFGFRFYTGTWNAWFDPEVAKEAY